MRHVHIRGAASGSASDDSVTLYLSAEPLAVEALVLAAAWVMLALVVLVVWVRVLLWLGVTWRDVVPERRQRG